MMLLIGLNDVPIKTGSFLVTARLAEVDEALVSDQRDPFACELTRRYASSSALELPEVFIERGIAAVSRIELLNINAESRKPLSDQPVMPGFVSDLPRKRKLHIELGSCRHPGGSYLAGLKLIFEGNAQKTFDGQLLRRFAGGAELTEPLERHSILFFKLGNEVVSGDCESAVC